MMASTLPADGVTLTFFPGWARQFPLHGWSLTGGSEMMDPFLITSNSLWTICCLLLHSVVGNWKKKSSFLPLCCYLLTHEAALGTTHHHNMQYRYHMPWSGTSAHLNKFLNMRTVDFCCREALSSTLSSVTSLPGGHMWHH
jgi:hypothetical protein